MLSFNLLRMSLSKFSQILSTLKLAALRIRFRSKITIKTKHRITIAITSGTFIMKLQHNQVCFLSFIFEYVEVKRRWRKTLRKKNDVENYLKHAVLFHDKCPSSKCKQTKRNGLSERNWTTKATKWTNEERRKKLSEN